MASRISFLGHGRFGAALATLFEDAGFTVRAMDPHADVPPERRAGSLADALMGAEFVIVAVPVPGMHQAFAELRPLLRSEQVVVDVGSVKLTPTNAMRDVFGATQPWAASHPLFGPVSLARGERPLRVVVCPNASHPTAVARVCRLYESLGCEVVEQDADAHDRAMAWTHALAFFVAKGMLDSGVPSDVLHAPPSFQAMARTIEAVRGDAGHLFSALHAENPYAAEARRTLTKTLVAIDESLLAAGPVPSPGNVALSIPDLGARSPELREIRDLIDEVDEQVVTLLARRGQLARKAARAKQTLGYGALDPLREAKLLENRRQWAAAAGLDADAVSEIFRLILKLSRRMQG